MNRPLSPEDIAKLARFIFTPEKPDPRISVRIVRNWQEKIAVRP